MGSDLGAGPSTHGREEVIETPLGPVTIRSHCPPGSFSMLELDEGIGHFAHYSSIIQKLEVFERVASSEGGNVTLALLNGRRIVGYGVCWYPDESERWAALGKLLYEMGALEVSRNFRRLGLAQKIIQLIMEDREFFAQKIAYMKGYSWHWDLDGSGLTIAQYRNMMIHLMKPYGFREYPTNEPNIAIREENLFLARIGERVSQEDRRRFRNLLFGVLED